MSKLILRPNATGTYNTHWSVHDTNSWQAINQRNSDGDTSYLKASTTGAFTVRFDDYFSGSYVRPTRVASITVIATVRAETPNPTRFQFRVRHLNTDYDSEVFTIDNATYVEVCQTYRQVPDGSGWNASRLQTLEAGLVYVDGQALRCTKLEVQVHTELYPHHTITPDIDSPVAGHQQWKYTPTTADAFWSVGRFDGDLSYIYTRPIWEKLTTYSALDLYGVWANSDTEIFFVGSNGVILFYDGSSTHEHVSGTTETLHGVWGTALNDVYAVGTSGTILHYDGTTWSPMIAGTVTTLRGIWGTATNDIFAVGLGGQIIHYDGLTWSPQVSGTGASLFSVWGATGTNVFAVGTGGTILNYNGAVWSPLVSGTANFLTSVWGTAANDVLAVGQLGIILHYNGAVWAPLVSGTIEQLNGVWMASSTLAFACGDNGTSLAYDGVNWVPQPINTQEDLNAIFGLSSTAVYVAAATGEAFFYDGFPLTAIATFGLTNPPAFLNPPYIDRVQVSGLVKNVGDVPEHAQIVLRSNSVDYFGAHTTNGWELPPSDKWAFIEEEFLNDPVTGWPSGAPGSTPWTPPQVDNIEVGLQATGGEFRCTTIAAEIFLKNTPVNTFEMFPTANSASSDYRDLDTLFPGTGEQAWQDVDEDPPDWGTTYISTDADTRETPQYSTFPVGPVSGPIAVGEQIYAVEVQLSLQLGSTDEAWIAPVIRYVDSTPDPTLDETYIGRPYRIEGTGTDWFQIKQDFFTSPFTGAPWNVADVNVHEYGIVLLKGEALLTRVRIQVQTANDFLAVVPSDTVELELTDAAVALITRSKGDGTIYAPLEFGIGEDGYSPTDPSAVTPVTTADTALGSEVYRDKIAKVTWDAQGAPPWEVLYWCRVPKEVALKGIGEVGLYAKIIWSPIPAEIDTWFLFAIMHLPCQCRHDKDVHGYTLKVNYP